jgi:5-methylcytosine-specific restriction protein A
MPDAPPKPCHHPGCRSFAQPGKARCAEHTSSYDRTTRRSNVALERAAVLRGSPTWKRVRTHFVSANPVCCDPFGEHAHGPEPTQDVHHVFPLATHPERALDTANLRPLCRACHNRIEALERTGTPTQSLFNL